MRVTIDVDDEVLDAAGALASARGLTLGQVVSELARRGLGSAGGGNEQPGYSPFLVIVGDPGSMLTGSLVADLRDG